MAGGTDQVSTITSARELMASSAAMERRVAARYGELATTMAAAGNADAASVLEGLEFAKRRHGDAIARRLSESGPEPTTPTPVRDRNPALDELADEDPYTTTAYRVLCIAVRNEQLAFAHYADIAAHAPDTATQRLAEGLAHEALQQAAALRRERREAWRRTVAGSGRRLPPPRNGGELRSLVLALEGRMAARQQALAAAAQSRGDAVSAELLRRVARKAEAPASAGDCPAPILPADARVFDLLRSCLLDLEDVYGRYVRAAESVQEEAAMLEAQRLAASAAARGDSIRRRLAALSRGPQL